MECLICSNDMKSHISWGQLFTRFQQRLCERCASKFERIDATIEIEPNFTVHALFRYNEMMKDTFHRYKFMHDTILADVFSQPIYEALKGRHVVPIPMHLEKMKERTFAPVELLLQSAGINYCSLLNKISTETQSAKSREERLQTPQIFNLRQKPQFECYTIFDDIVTTGVTLKHAKSLLLEAGAKEIRCVTLIKA